MELKTNIRNSNVELLRIVAMLMVIFHHALSQGFSFDFLPEPSLNLSFFQAANCFGWLGNMLFIIISGYYLSESRFSLKKIIKLWLLVFFYSAGISCILFVFKIQIYGVEGNGFCLTRLLEKRDLKATELFFSFFPVVTAQNWFATKYIVFLFFVPFLNRIVQNVSCRLHFMLIALCFLLFEFLPLFPWTDVYEINNYSAFFLLFFAGSFVKKYNEYFYAKRKALLAVGIIYFSFYIAIRFVLMNLYGYAESVPFLFQVFVMSSHAHDFVMTVSAFLIFTGTVNLPAGSNKVLNKIASTTFGVYLLHNHNYFRRNLWFDVFKLNQNFESENLIGLTIFSVVCVFVLCSLIEYLRFIILEPAFNKVSELISAKILKLVKAA